MSRNQKIAAGALVVCVLFFATYKLNESPPFWFDEGLYFQTSANLATTGIDGLQLAPQVIHHESTFITVGYPLIYPLALWFKIFGVSVTNGRSLMVLFILAFVLVSFILARKLFGTWAALGALALLATFPPLYGNGKSILGEVPGLLYLVLFLLFLNLAKSLPNKKIFYLVISAICAGLCVATKPFFILLLPAVLVGFCIEWKRKHISVKEGALWACVAAIPVIIWLVVQFHGGNSLLSVLHFYANPYHVGSVTQMVLINIKRLFSDVGTLYTVCILIAWTWALILRRISKEEISGEEIIAFIFSIFTVLSFLRTGGLYRYLFPAQVIALVFLPASLMRISHFIRPLAQRENLRKNLVITAVGLLSLLGLYQLAFNSWVADAYASHKTAFWLDYFDHLSPNTSVFFYNTPEVVPLDSHRNYYQYVLLYDHRQIGTTADVGIGDEERALLARAAIDQVIVPTNIYEADDQGVFKAYTQTNNAYKYSILMRRSTHPSHE